MNEILAQRLKDNSVVKEVLNKGNRVGNLFPMEEAVILATAFQVNPKTRIIVKKNRYEAQQLYQRLEPLLDDVLLFVMEESLRVQAIASSPEDKEQVVAFLSTCLMEPKERIIICNTAAFLRFLPDVSFYQSMCQTLKVDMELDMNTLKAQLQRSGYAKVNYVDRPCTYASRGGIIDIFSLQYENPIRIEFFDTEIDSIRFFDETSQRTIRAIDQVTIGPASDILFTDEQIQTIHQKVAEKCAKQEKRLPEEQFSLLQENIENDLMALDSYDPDAHLYWYYSYCSRSSILDYVSGQVIISNMEEVQEEVKDLKENNIVFMQEMIADQRALPQYECMHDFDRLSKSSIAFHEFLDFKDPLTSNLYPIEKASLPVQEQLEQWHFEEVFFAVSNEAKARLKPYLKGKYTFIEPCFYEGFSYENWAVLTEKELFIQKTKQRRYKKTFKEGQIIESVLELEKYDYVVHEQYGIGQYLGIVTKEVNKQKLDYLHIIYAGGDDLFVPLSQFQLVRKYISKEGVGIHLSKLGSDQWKKTKAKVNKKVEEIAERLIELYASRNENIGFAYAPDDALQQEFEEAFIYEPTPDQIRATKEIKREMEKPKPMDHLLCGDVGFGKTEVAMRCAFKAITNGKQVVFLCPTTILSMQHYQTLSKRFAYTGANIALVNRFVSTKEIKEIKQKLAAGMIDIVIGTHKLLNKTFQYKDLGLLIIDEEQRFGVTHKERIKEMKNSIDVLSLSATPIPRTLQMSLIGVRTISQLNTAPAQRHPIQTYVMEKRGRVIKEIIQRELSRSGQVFYLYNDISKIYKVAENLQTLFPDAQIGVAHGRMSREEIEKTMIDFANKVYDVLVCTTIIETGLDIENANTMIIENADRFGLSQLYQIRGRVGRREKIAYCYLMVQPNKVLNEQARKRLKSIKEFTQLGSGYKIAMRDLTIRGAGDLLGPQQAGFIDQIGLDLYLEMLGNAIKTKKGEKVEETKEKTAKIAMNGYIPKEFTSNDGDKLSLYQDISKVHSPKELDAYKKRIEDLYGRIPASVEKLFERRRIDLFVNQPGVDSLMEKQNEICLTMDEAWSSQCDGVKLFETMNEISRKIQLSLKAGKIEIVIKNQKNPYDLLMKIIQVLTEDGESYARR